MQRFAQYALLSTAVLTMISPRIAVADVSEIERLIKQLGSDDFSERESASKRLEAIGEPAWNAVRKAARDDSDAEIRWRCKRAEDAIGRRCFGEIRHFGSKRDYWLNRVAFSSDGRRALATGGAVILFDLETGKELYRVLEVKYARLGLVLSKDCRYFLTGHDHDKVVRLGSIRSGKEVQRFEGHTAGVRGVALSPDASRAATGGLDETLRLWDVKTGRELRQFQSRAGKIRCLAYAPDGRHILSGHFGKKSNNLVCLWDVDTGKEVRRFEGHSGEVTAVVFLPGGGSFLSASMDGTLRIWDLSNGKELRRLEHRGGVNDVKVSPDGCRALSAGRGDRSVRLWDLASGTELYRFVGHTAGVLGVAFSPDGCRALSSDASNILRLWRLPKPDMAPDKAPHQQPVKKKN